jgi:hypothetical protein
VALSLTARKAANAFASLMWFKTGKLFAGICPKPSNITEYE